MEWIWLAESRSGPKSIRKTSSISADARLRSALPPIRQADSQLSQLQNGSG
ncbi:MAG: hypothetical protein M3412_05295 [Chloroflexota bacterium]|nr:hypothetical protein [Chloroflexota bacterium]